MGLRNTLRDNLRHGRTGAVLTALLGLVFLITPIGKPLSTWSYDYAFFFRPKASVDDVRVVYMDRDSHEEFLQSPNLWHRVLHAELIRALDRAGARAIVFDVTFDLPWTNQAVHAASESILLSRFGYRPDQLVGHAVDGILSNAIQQARCPVVAGVERVISDEGLTVYKMPHESLGTNLTWGMVDYLKERDNIIRQHYRPGPDGRPSLASVAARLAGHAPESELRARWINYYGPRNTLPGASYQAVFEPDRLEPGYFSNRVVYVGMESFTTGQGSRNQTDEWPTPYSRWKGSETTGVEIHATAFLNLYRGEWLRQFPWWLEALAVVFMGCLYGFGLVLARPWVAVRFSILAVVLTVAIGISLVWTTGFWIAWLLPVAIQIPAALAWSVVANTKKLYREKAALEESLATARSGGLRPDEATRVMPPRVGGEPVPIRKAAVPPRPGEPVAPPIPDHEMLKCVGKGAYGEVWLARDVIGSFHAVKVVYRRNFTNDGPYDREFRGIQKFTPISRSHPGLVNILHVGRNEQAGYFYCIMEAGDDERTGQAIDPESYAPRNLARELNRRGTLDAGECVRLGVDLARALAFLHSKGLIHRDIKPSNIIFVNGTPKFADIGLVTEIAATGRDVSFLGTEGFIAPEGPGTPAADVFSLGKLLYEAAMGRDREHFPELPTDVDRRPDEGLLMRLNEVILKACEYDAAERYTSATELLTDLERLR